MKRIKYLGINLPKETKDIYLENYKTLMKEIESKMTQIGGEIYYVFGWKNQHCEDDYITQSNLQVQYNHYKTTNGISP